MSRRHTNLRIIIATLLRETGESGVQTHFNALRDYARSVGVEVEVVTPFSGPRWLVYPLFAVRRVIDRLHGEASIWWYRHWHRFFLYEALRRKLATCGPAVVYAVCPSSAKVALDARVPGRHRVVMSVHFGISEADEWAGKGIIPAHGRLHQAITRFEADVLPRVDGMVYVSRFLQKTLEQRIPALAKTPSAVIPNFCAVPPRPVDPATASGLISVGILAPPKNQQFLLRVLAEAAREGKRYDLTLMGEGPDRGKLERLARELGLEKQVRLVGYQPNAARLLSAHRVYVHGSWMETFSIVMIEAMAAGLPLLAAPVGGVPEVLQDGCEGLFWPLDDPASAAGKLISVMEDPQLWRRFSSAARARHAAHFRTDQVAPRLLDFLGEARASA